MTEPGLIDVGGFSPFCQVCAKPVPGNRKHNSNWQHTCSPECQALWKQWKRFSLGQRKCVACLRPSSPQEREDFLAWRRARGQKRAELGRPPVRRELKLLKALEASTAILDAWLLTLKADTPIEKNVRRAVAQAKTAMKHAGPLAAAAAAPVAEPDAERDAELDSPAAK